jgi:hypothetical protein
MWEKCKRVTKCYACRKIMDVGEQRYTYLVNDVHRSWWQVRRYLCASCAAGEQIAQEPIQVSL